MNAPVLLLLYKRPETTIQVINALKKIKPKLIYISINIPPNNKNNKDYENHKKVLNLINKIDWQCVLKIKKRKKHLSAYNSYKNAVDWFFKNEKEGIVLEDDTVPNKSFFTFCSQLLKKYRNNKKIAMICGTQFDSKKKINKDTYLFSNFPMMWGYATWRRTIKDHDDKMKDWPKIKKNFFSGFTNNKMFIKYWTKIFNDGYSKKFQAYDFQMFYSNLKNKRLSVVPKRNLVKNVGFVDGATHTKTKQWYSELETHELKHIKHPKIIIPDLNYDNWINVNVFQIMHFYSMQKIKKYKIFKSKIILKMSKSIYKIFYYFYYYKIKSFFLRKNYFSSNF
jgi:hypothetical protein